MSFGVRPLVPESWKRCAGPIASISRQFQTKPSVTASCEGHKATILRPLAGSGCCALSCHRLVGGAGAAQGLGEGAEPSTHKDPREAQVEEETGGTQRARLPGQRKWLTSPKPTGCSSTQAGWAGSGHWRGPVGQDLMSSELSGMLSGFFIYYLCN